MFRGFPLAVREFLQSLASSCRGDRVKAKAYKAYLEQGRNLRKSASPRFPTSRSTQFSIPSAPTRAAVRWNDRSECCSNPRQS